MSTNQANINRTMLKLSKFTGLILTLLFIGFLTSEKSFAQKRKSQSKTKKQSVKAIEAVTPAILLRGSGGASGSYKPEPYLSLEPCAKETPEQIAELENAGDAKQQVEILLKRIDEKDDWLRACSIYRLGEFRASAREALPLIIKLLRDEKNDDIWRHVEDALWKIPPDANLPLRERIELSKNNDVYLRLYGVYSLGYFKPVAGTFQAKDALNALIEAAKDEDSIVSWLAVMGIRQLGFYGINTKDAIPVLTEILQSDKMNSIHPIRAFVPMGENALPAAPILFDVLYNPNKYAGKDEDNVRSHLL